MTGRLIADPSARLPHTRIVMRFRDGGSLVLTDVRKFGRLRIIDGDPRAALEIGIDPFDRALTPARLAGMLRGRTTKIKTWLMDQRRLAGVGNIYASEALFDAGIRPTRRAGRLTAVQTAALLRSLRKVMRKAIYHRGSSVDDYVDAEGMPGEFQNKLAVYGRGGLPCRRCQATIRRVVLAQRGTFFCPVCQR
jgi:formamidopyrimidine-DNA glycosylase